MNSTARLVIRLGSQPEEEYPITQEITILGREAINDVVVNDVEVSRRHCRLMLDQNGYVLEDLGSTNGTFVNGQRVTVPTVLYHGDTIELGKSARVVFLGSAPVASAPIAETPAPTPVGYEAPLEPLDDADYYLPTDDDGLEVDAAESDYEYEDEGGGCRRYLISCGCLILLLIFLLGAALFIIDQTACDLLYCGTLKPFWEGLLGLFGRSLSCPC